MKVTILRYAAIGMAALSLTGFAAATSGNDGHSSHKNRVKEVTNVNIRRTNTVDVKNTNTQTAVSGQVEVKNNTRVGDVQSGEAKNTNQVSTKVALNQPSGCQSGCQNGCQSDCQSSNCPCIDNLLVPIDSGFPPLKDDQNKGHIIKRDLNINTTNDVTVKNDNQQKAYSGDVTVKDNTTVGNVSSGSAVNSNDVKTKVKL